LNKFAVSVIADDESPEMTVLKIASASRNTSSQLYSDRIQVSRLQLEDLDKKIRRKLQLHGIHEVDTDATLHFENDRIEGFQDFAHFMLYDLKIDNLTESLSFKWSFIFDSANAGTQHLHSIYVRFADTPAPGVLLQKMLSARAEDAEGVEPDFFSPVVCKLDFADNRFSSELFAVVTDWVKAQPRVEPTFGFVLKLRLYREKIKRFIENTLPTLAVLAYVGIWLGLLPEAVSSSTKYAVAWMLGGAAVFLLSRYCSGALGRILERHVLRVTLAPVFQLTSGDNNRVTKYLARSQKSAITIVVTGVLYGIAQAIGLYLASKILTHLL